MQKTQTNVIRQLAVDIKKMKYYQLFIDIETENKAETFGNVTDLLGLKPTGNEEDKASKDRYGLWMYMVTKNDSEPYFDFINSFLNILEPKFSVLEKLGVTIDDITFWMLYEYEHQCAMEFSPKEMARLGQSGIHLCIDCWEKRVDQSANA